MKTIISVVTVVFAVIACSLVAAQEAVQVQEEVSLQEQVATQPPAEQVTKQRIDVGFGYWYGWSKLDSYVYAPANDSGTGILYAKGDKISELNNDLDCGIFIVNADVWIWWRFYADGFLGWGEFDGEHEDSDWLTLLSPNKWSLSKSDADGDIQVWNVNGRLRLIEEPNDKGFLDFSAGYFHYRDDIEHLRNSTQVISNWVVVNTPIVGHDSQDKYTFDGWRLGLKGRIRLHDRLAIKAEGGICPWANVENEGYWNLRGMKIDASADGTIYDLTAGIEFKITKNLFIEAGYKYINLDSDQGDDTRTWSDGTKITYKDAFEAEGHRGGFYGMGRLKF